jgi:diguanylate cyclase (GGDEF)-like protein
MTRGLAIRGVDGHPTRMAGSLSDVTDRRIAQLRLQHDALHDTLTGLPNRTLFVDRLNQILQRSLRDPETGCAVLFLDIDRFKLVNDSLSHGVGDNLLIALAGRVSAALRPGDTVARLGGDEFTVLLEDINGVEDAEGVATRMVESLEAPIQLEGGYEVVARVSIGIALTTGLQAADDVLHDADAAMYQAKAHKIGGYQVFDAAAMQARSVERFDLEADLRRALDNHEMEVYFQPMFSSETFEIVGAEALVRWNHPLRGLLAPGQFIGVAEETGLILPLGRQVMEQACVAAQGWVDHRGNPLSTTVNLSTRQFLDPYLVRDIMETLEKTGVPPSQICIEITESLAVDDVDRTDRTLSELKALGLRIAIDDFGTGFSSLKYLKQFPADIVKIDQSFVHGLEASPVDSAIVSAVINLAKAIGMTTVAEGVETVPQLDHLRTMGCPVIQGYLFSRPIQAEALTKLLDRRSVETVSSVA